VPSGLALRDGLIFAADNATSVVFAVDRDGNVRDFVQIIAFVPSGGLMGIAFDAEGRLYMVDAIRNRVLRMSPR